MASLIWTCVFIFLVVEIVVTVILVTPVPRRIRNYFARCISKLRLGERLAKPVIFVGVALSLALVESYLTHQRIVAKLSEAENYHHHDNYGVGASPDRIFDKERKYKAERNMYLTGFSLTLLFVIFRIAQLMQESVQLEEEVEIHKQLLKDAPKIEEYSSAGRKKKK